MTNQKVQKENISQHFKCEASLLIRMDDLLEIGRLFGPIGLKFT